MLLNAYLLWFVCRLLNYGRFASSSESCAWILEAILVRLNALLELGLVALDSERRECFIELISASLIRLLNTLSCKVRLRRLHLVALTNSIGLCTKASLIHLRRRSPLLSVHIWHALGTTHLRRLDKILILVSLRGSLVKEVLCPHLRWWHTLLKRYRYLLLLLVFQWNLLPLGCVGTSTTACWWRGRLSEVCAHSEILVCLGQLTDLVI